MGWRVKKLSIGGGSKGNGRTILISSWKCNFSIYLDIQVYYLDIQAITTLLAFYWLFMCGFLLFLLIFYLTTTLLESDIFRHSNPTPPTVFNLQALDWVHCEEETGAYYQLSWFAYKLVIHYLKKISGFYFTEKIRTFQKNH